MFNRGQEYRRRDIHRKYGGNWQSGIAPCKDYPFIFIFTSSSGKAHGYKDGWVNEDIFEYTGEGQLGNMEFVRGNLQLRDHIANGKRVFLFESTRKAFVRYVDELEFNSCDFFDTIDNEGKIRRGIKFFFKRVGSNLYVPSEARETNQYSLEFNNELNYSFTKPNETERKGLITSRVGQGAYRKSILHRWKYKCAVTEYDNTKILIASHIVSWKNSTNSQRLDVDNGILLSPNYDALFDRHLISFDENGKIILTNKLKESAYSKLGISGSEVISSLTDENQNYLEQHRSRLL